MYKKLIPRMVYMEPELWRQMIRFSLLYGCKKHPSRGSGSEAVRKFIKTGVLLKKPECKNIKEIDWDELYN